MTASTMSQTMMSSDHRKGSKSPQSFSDTVSTASNVSSERYTDTVASTSSLPLSLSSDRQEMRCSNHGGRSIRLGSAHTVANGAGARASSGAESLHQLTLATETNNMRTARKLAEISRSSLDFSRISLVGRDKEKRVLDRAFQQILKSVKHVGAPAKRPAPGMVSSDEDPNLNTPVGSSQTDDGDSNDRGATKTAAAFKGSESAASDVDADTESTVRSFVSISGYSGTGKSALAATLRPKCKANHIFFVTGKFDLKQMDEPYSGFRTAMADLCSQICSLPRTSGAGTHKTAVEQPTTTSKGHNTHNTHKVKNTRSFDGIRDSITEALNVDELQALVKIIPNLVDVIGSDALEHPDITAATGRNANINDDGTVVSTAQRAHAAKGFKQQSIALKFAFRRFIKIICHCCPLVWVSDDVQWADKESLDMIESWMLDTTISSLMVVVCFRSNLVDSDGPAQSSDTASVSSRISHISQMLASIQKKRRERFIRYVDLEVNNMPLDDVHVMLKQLLGIYSDDDIGNGGDGDAHAHSSGNDSSYGLAEIVFKKTDGNVFFVQQFLRMLVNDNLLTYDMASMKWVWDNEQIKQETPATINVVELMELKLQQIETAKYMLPLAACLGSTFSWMLLRTTLEGFVEDGRRTNDEGHRTFYESLFGGPPPSSEDEWLSILKTYEEEGLIESHMDSSNSYNNSKNSKNSNDSSIYDDDENSELIEMGTSMSTSIHTTSASSVVSECSFIHDKVQEAALAIIPSKMQLTELQYRIGIILMDRLIPDDFETSLFVITNLLNSRSDMIPPYPPSIQSAQRNNDNENYNDSSALAQSRRFRIARLNFDAGTKAVLHGAFRGAFSYFQNAIDLMPPCHWQSHREMSIQLFTSAAECAYVSNKFDKMQEYGHEVIELDDCPLIDKMRAYHVLMEGLSTMNHHDKATDMMQLGYDVLAKLGYRYPKNKRMRSLCLAKGMLKLKRSARKWTIEYLESLEPAEDPMVEMALKTLCIQSLTSLLCDPDVYPLILLDMVKATMKKGRTNFAPLCIGNLSLLIGPILGDMQAAKAYGNHGLQINKTISDPSAASRTVVFTYSLVLNNIVPFESCKQPLLDVYPIAMAGGDVQIALWSIVFYLDLCRFTARSLASLDTDYSTYTKICVDFNQAKVAQQLSIRWQIVLNLMGRSDHRTLLVGDAFDEVAATHRLKQADDSSMRYMMSQAKMYVATYFGDYEQVVEVRIQAIAERQRLTPGHMTGIPSAFCAALSATIVMNQASRSNRGRIKPVHTQALNMLQTAVKKGNPNAVHYLAIVNAEKTACQARKRGAYRRQAFRNAVQMYQDAIRITGRGGWIQDQALANERLARHMLLEDDRKGARYRFDEAIRLYREWGADGKVEQLQEQQTSIWG